MRNAISREAVPDIAETSRDFLSRHRIMVILAVILLLSFGIRFYGLGERPLWEDEALWAMTSQQLAEEGGVIPRYQTSDDFVTGHPPGFFHFNALTYRIVDSPAEFHLRFLSALFGALTVLLMYLLGRQIFDPGVGLLAALFLALSSNHAIYSRQVHPAALGIFLMGASVYLWIRAARNGSPRIIAVALASSILAVSTHFMNFVLVLFLPLLFFLEDGWREEKERGAWTAGGYLALVSTVFAYTVWSINNAVPPKKSNPFYHSFSLSEGVGTFMERVLGLPRILITEYLAAVPVRRFLDGMWSLLSFYANPSYLYLPAAMGLVPLLDLRDSGGWRDLSQRARDTLIPYAWFLATFFLLGVPVLAIYAVNDMRPLRGHPFLVLPVLLLAARGGKILYGKRKVLGIIPVLLVLTYVTHIPPVTAGAVMNEEMGDSVNQSVYHTGRSVQAYFNSTDVFFDVDVENRRVWFDASTGTTPRIYTPKILTETESIVCTEEEFRPLFCFNRHPVGFNDGVDWRDGTSYLVENVEESEPVYASVAAPVLFYAGNMSNEVTGLSCNVEHRFCNMSKILVEEAPLWVVTDERRIEWQFTEHEKEYMRENCEREKAGSVHLYWCPPRG